MQYVMWGDTLEATARMHSINRIEQLRFEHLLDRDVSSWTTADEERVRILDLDMYVRNLALPLMYFRFVEVTGFNEYGEPIMRNLNIDGIGALMPYIELTIDNAPDPYVIPNRHTVNTPVGNLSVHQPIPANPGTGTFAGGNFTQQNVEGRANLQHFRAEGMSENTTFSVVDTTGTFITISDRPVSDFFEWFYPLYMVINEGLDTESQQRLVFSGAQANRETQYENAIEGDPIFVRTLVIPLLRLREEEVRIVERIAPGVYEPINNSTLVHNSHVLTPNEPGIFTMRDEEFNILNANAPGFMSREINAYSGILNELLAETEGQYIRIVLEPRILEVTFDLQGGEAQGDFPSQTIRYGLTATQPNTNPTRAGTTLDYEFDGWFTTPTGGTPFNFAMPITENTTVYARWTARYQVTFDLQGGEAQANFPNQAVRHGDFATEPTTYPINESDHFDGWFTAPTGGEKFDFATPITEDTTIYARWLSVVNFEFTKMDYLLYTDPENAIVLEGAMFNLYIWEYVAGDYTWLLLEADVESDEDGLVRFGNLVSGNQFRLIETKAPEAFRTPMGYWYIEIEDDRTMTITRSLDETGNQREDVRFIFQDDRWFVGNLNIEFISFSFFKMDELMYIDFETATFLPDAVFELYRNQNGEWVMIDTQESDQDGFIEFTTLTLGGNYKLVEVTAPTGYQIPRGHWLIDVNSEGEFIIAAYGDLVLAFLVHENQFYLGNLDEFALPGLGGLGLNQWLAFVGLAIMIASVCTFLIVKKRQKIIFDE